jgi:hypothetical protein
MCAAAAQSSENGEDVKYVSPDGFGGHKWGEVRAAFHRLPEPAIDVGAAWMPLQQKQTGYTCHYVDTAPKYVTAWIETCRYQETLLRPVIEMRPGGSYVVSEYAVEDQGFRYGDELDGVILYPVFYEFCAKWQGPRKRPSPPNFDEINRFCGMRFMFRSASAEELSKMPLDHVTNYDRVLKRLVNKYGPPLGFRRYGKVYIDPLDSDFIDEEVQRRFHTWRWCPAPEANGLRTLCLSSISLSVDPVTGIGTVLFATPILWEFAYAREFYGFPGDATYKMLHSRN